MCEKSSSHDRKVQSYLKPKNDYLFKAYVEAEQISESSAINIMVKDFFLRMPEEQKKYYISHFAKSQQSNK